MVDAGGGLIELAGVAMNERRPEPGGTLLKLFTLLGVALASLILVSWWLSYHPGLLGPRCQVLSKVGKICGPLVDGK